MKKNKKPLRKTVRKIWEINPITRIHRQKGYIRRLNKRISEEMKCLEKDE